MNIATIAALAVTLGLPAPAQQSATKIIMKTDSLRWPWTNSSQPGCATAE